MCVAVLHRGLYSSMHNYTFKIYHILEVATQYGDMCQRNVRALRNKPFFMYLAFRAPHAPYSHNMTLDEIQNSLPHSIIGKPGEQIMLLDKYVEKYAILCLQGLFLTARHD